MLLMNIVVARLLPPDQVGIFLWSVAVLMLGSVVVRMGTDNSVLRLAAIAFSEGDLEGVRGQKWYSLLLVGLVSLFVSINAIAVISLWPLFASDKKWALVFMLIAIVPFSLLFLQTRFLIAERRSSLGIFLSTAAPFLCFTALILCYPSGTAATAAVAFLAACVVSLVLALVMSPPGKALVFPARPERKALLLMSRHFWLIAVFSEVIIWISQILAAIWCTPDELAWLAIGQRFAAIVSLPLIAVRSVVLPQFATAMDQENFPALEKGLREGVLMGLFFSAPLFICIVTVPEFLIRVTVGDQYLEAVNLVFIFSVGQLINVSAGVSGGVLAMTGNEKVLRNIVVSSGLLCIFLSVAFIPVYGPVGAAVAFSSTMVVQNVAMFSMSRRFIRSCIEGRGYE